MRLGFFWVQVVGVWRQGGYKKNLKKIVTFDSKVRITCVTHKKTKKNEKPYRSYRRIDYRSRSKFV